MNYSEKQPDKISPQKIDTPEATTEIPHDTPSSDEVELSLGQHSPPPVAQVSNTDATPVEVAAAPAAVENATLESTTDNQATEAISPASVEELQREVSDLKAQLEDKTNQIELFKNQYVRIVADFENFRKRTLKEKEDLEIQVKCATISDLLSAVDSFERARSHIKPQNDGEMNIHKSYQSVYKQMVDGLKRIGVSPMRPEGKEFDPNLHEAVMREPTDSHPEGTVIEELVRGYYLGDRVVRHAMVKVAAPMELDSPSEESDPSTTQD